MMNKLTKKQWRGVRGASRLRGFLGARGVLSRKIKSVDELIHIAAAVFQVPIASSVAEMDAAVAALSPEDRKTRAEQSIPKIGKMVPMRGRASRSRRSADRLTSRGGPQESTIRVDDPRLKEFYKSTQWCRLSYDVKIERGRRCECCGATPADGARIITDHIKPIRKYWHLRLQRSNLQVLCDDCNLGKGSRDETDFREETQVSKPVVVLSRADCRSGKDRCRRLDASAACGMGCALAASRRLEAEATRDGGDTRTRRFAAYPAARLALVRFLAGGSSLARSRATSRT